MVSGDKIGHSVLIEMGPKALKGPFNLFLVRQSDTAQVGIFQLYQGT